MSAIAAKKPPPTGREATASPTASPSRQTPRASTPSSTASGTGVARTRSIRTGTPVSARAAAAHSRKESLLASAAGGSGRNSPGPGSGAGAGSSIEAEEAARAETIAVMDDLRERLSKAEVSSESNKRQAEVLQARLDEALADHAKLEERVHEQEEQIEALQNSKREAARQIREMETIYEAERSSMVKEKEEMSNREEEMQTVIQRLKDSLAQRTNGEEDGRPSRQTNNNSPSVDGGFAPPASLHRSDSRNNSKILLQKDKLIESLRLELAEAQIKLVESENQGGGRLQEVERLLMETRMANARLLEDNESYQLLLQERTLNGDFGKSDFSYMGGGSSSGGGGGGGGANQDALAALEGRPSGGSSGGRPSSTGAAAASTSLADELSDAHDAEAENNHRRLEAELRSAKDQNKALTLYINKIIERLLQHQDFESILDTSSDFKPTGGAANTNKELPPPPPQQPSMLQRVRSMAAGAGSAGNRAPRPRPMTFMPSPTPSAHVNPETAPSIPIGLTRNTSVRRGAGRPMSEQFTGGSVVNQMYRGADGRGPLISPTLRGAQTFFEGHSSSSRSPSGNQAAHHHNSQQPHSGGGGAGGAVPLSTSGNFPGMRSETSSTSGDSVRQGSVSDVTTPPSHSPPRGGGGAEKSTMTFAGGNKPRPLRLVQENPDVKAAETANKRASWFGWAMGAAAGAGAKKDEGGQLSGGGGGGGGGHGHDAIRE